MKVRSDMKFTCKQHLTIIFNFEPPVTTLQDLQAMRQADSRAIRQSAERVSLRYTHIASMLDILTALHDGWQISRKKDRLIMETDGIDYQDVKDNLSKQGFLPQDYQLRIDYERKWGLL